MIEPYVIIALLIGLLGGLSPIINKHLLNKFNHATLLVVSSIVYSIFSIIYIWLNQKLISKEIKTVTYNDFFIISFEAIACAFLVDLLFYYILKDNDSHMVCVLIYTSPIFTFLFAYLFLNERINMEKIAGLFIIFAGISLIMRESI
jgi:uncharacterized membrane protein